MQYSKSTSKLELQYIQSDNTMTITYILIPVTDPRPWI